MADPELVVNLGADGGELTDELGKTEDELKDVARAMRILGPEFEAMWVDARVGIKGANDELDGLKVEMAEYAEVQKASVRVLEEFAKEQREAIRAELWRESKEAVRQLNEELNEASRRSSTFRGRIQNVRKSVSGALGLSRDWYASLMQTAVISAVKKLVGVLNSAEKAYIKAAKGGAKAYHEMQKAVEDVKVEVGELWFELKKPWYEEITKIAKGFKENKAELEATKEATSTFGDEYFRNFKRNIAVVGEFFSKTQVLGLVLRKTADDFGAARDEAARLNAELEKMQEDAGPSPLTRLPSDVTTDWRQKEQEQLAKQAEQNRQRAMAHEQWVLGAEDRKLAKQREAMEAQRRFRVEQRRAFEENIRTQKTGLQEAIELQKEQGKTDWERFQQADKALKDYAKRDEDTGFRASITSLTGMYSRIQSTAASRRGEDTVKKELEQRRREAKDQYERGAKKFDKMVALLEKIEKQRTAWQGR